MPSGAPTLGPNYIAVLADKVAGNTESRSARRRIGNVHILYGAEEIVGDNAHYDGLRTITITGHPFIINHAKDSVLEADKISFDTIDQTAMLTNGRGTSSEGVNVGLVHFSAKDLHTDAEGIGHGLAPSVTTCEHQRGGYHITGRNMDVYPGDKIVIYNAMLWLGAAAVFYLPKVVIPLRTVDNPNQRPKYFPDVGYDQYEGYLDQDAHHVRQGSILLRLLRRQLFHEGRPRPRVRRVLHQEKRPSQREHQFLRDPRQTRRCDAPTT